jgi:Tripartite tricarboxylate transporter TctB family
MVSRRLLVKIKSQKDFLSGLMFLVVGGVFAWGATSYSIGTGARMGPGYFPLMLGILLTILGGFILFSSLIIETPDGDKVSKIAWKPLCYILGANLLFGVLLGGLPSIGLPSFGLIAAIFALIIISSKAGDEFEWKSVIILSATLSAGSYLAFIALLKLQMPVWPWFVGN